MPLGTSLGALFPTPIVLRPTAAPSHGDLTAIATVTAALLPSGPLQPHWAPPAEHLIPHHHPRPHTAHHHHHQMPCPLRPALKSPTTTATKTATTRTLTPPQPTRRASKRSSRPYAPPASPISTAWLPRTTPRHSKRIACRTWRSVRAAEGGSPRCCETCTRAALGGRGGRREGFSRVPWKARVSRHIPIILSHQSRRRTEACLSVTPAYGRSIEIVCVEEIERVTRLLERTHTLGEGESLLALHGLRIGHANPTAPSTDADNNHESRLLAQLTTLPEDVEGALQDKVSIVPFSFSLPHDLSSELPLNAFSFRHRTSGPSSPNSPALRACTATEYRRRSWRC